jgi:hypothetical protein
MRIMALIIALGAAAAISSVAEVARAEPASAARPQHDLDAQTQHIAYRSCWWQNGERHCRRVHGDNWIPSYGAGSPDDYRVGTAEWYRAMERDGRLNRGRGRQ